MAIKGRKLTARFAAESQDGQRFEILVYADVLDASSRRNPGAEVEGLKTAVTSEGYHVNRIDDMSWEIVELHLRVSRTEG